MTIKLFKEILKIETRYENLLLLLLSCILAYILLTPSYMLKLESLIQRSGDFGYIGTFFAGLFYTFSFSSIPATAVLYVLGMSLNPLLVAIIGASGATITDYMIFLITKKKFSQEVARIERKKKLRKISKWIHHLAPILAFLVIASPLPDEFAAGFLGSIRLDKKIFIPLIFLADFFGILILSSLGHLLA